MIRQCYTLFPKRKPEWVHEFCFGWHAHISCHRALTCTELKKINLCLHQTAGICSSVQAWIVELSHIILPEAYWADVMRTWKFIKNLMTAARACVHGHLRMKFRGGWQSWWAFRWGRGLKRWPAGFIWRSRTSCLETTSRALLVLNTVGTCKRNARQRYLDRSRNLEAMKSLSSQADSRSKAQST